VLVDGMSSDAAQDKTNLCACSGLPHIPVWTVAGRSTQRWLPALAPDRKRGGCWV